jgi:hypothetical protein
VKLGPLTTSSEITVIPKVLAVVQSRGNIIHYGISSVDSKRAPTRVLCGSSSWHPTTPKKTLYYYSILPLTEIVRDIAKRPNQKHYNQRTFSEHLFKVFKIFFGYSFNGSV